ncbi:isochorismatase family cysteine hydrolase [Reyranella soli]|uniref:Isochorismatase n=1 Tax=Reyranella soli TaxID=1230389 RepID=A0A512NF99_9HYPH|nr:isochorismatase family cysteine hydrolase [Reyranella soli]GEP57616.1 isochorismatase [Reyranella soli]
MMSLYDSRITSLLCIDFYNDFLSVGGKLWPWVKVIAEEVNLLVNTIVTTAREAEIKVYHVPHHRWEPGDYVDWKYPSAYQLGAAERPAFAKDTWGGTFHNDFPVRPGDIVVTEHWASSGFPNTDLEHQLKRYGKEKIICIGLLANTRLEATARIGMELGFHVSLARNGTAARSHEALHAMLDIDGPTFAREFLTAVELVSGIRLSVTNEQSAA